MVGYKKIYRPKNCFKCNHLTSTETNTQKTQQNTQKHKEKKQTNKKHQKWKITYFLVMHKLSIHVNLMQLGIEIFTWLLISLLFLSIPGGSIFKYVQNIDLFKIKLILWKMIVSKGYCYEVSKCKEIFLHERVSAADFYPPCSIPVNEYRRWLIDESDDQWRGWSL